MILPQAGCVEGQETMYLDASNGDDPYRDGTQAHPYVSLAEAGVTSNTSYYLKRSGRYTMTSPVIISGKENIRISAYGEGERPVLYAGGLEKGIDIQNSSRVTLSNIALEGSRDTDFLIRVIGNSSRVLVKGCSIQRAVWGIRLIGFNQRSHIRDVHIQDCEISQTGDDGIFVNHLEGLKIDSCRISRVNQKWFYAGRQQGESPGDAIQIGQSRDFTITNCRIDRSDTGNKFCIIISSSQLGRIAGNKLQGPSGDGDGGASVYLGHGTDSVEVAYNDIARSPTGIYDKSRSSLIYRNIIRQNATGLWSGSRKECRVVNNTFYNNRMSIGGDRLNVTNNIFYNDSLPGKMVQFQKNCRSDYNCYYNTKVHEVFSPYGSLKMYQAATGQGKHSLFADPVFARNLSHDFRLAKESPCIDRGRREMSLRSNTRICGAGLDLGAEESCSPVEDGSGEEKKFPTTIKTISYEY